MGITVTYWIGSKSPEAAAETINFCFDCPLREDWLGPFPFAVWAGLSLVFAIPSFFSGMLIHRKLISTAMVFRLLIVAATAPLFWFLWFFASDPWLEISRISESFAFAASHIVDISPVIAGASALAAIASSFDALRVKELRSPTYFADY